MIPPGPRLGDQVILFNARHVHPFLGHFAFDGQFGFQHGVEDHLLAVGDLVIPTAHGLWERRVFDEIAGGKEALQFSSIIDRDRQKSAQRSPGAQSTPRATVDIQHHKARKAAPAARIRGR